MKKVVFGSLHQATGLELNRITNQNICQEIESDPKLKEFLQGFAVDLQSKNSEQAIPNAKALRHYAALHKKAGNTLPITPKQLKSKTVLYLRAMKNLGWICLLLLLFSSCAHRSHPPAIPSLEKAHQQVLKANESVTKTKQLSVDTSNEIQRVRVNLDRVDAKDSVITQWEAYQKRKHQR